MPSVFKFTLTLWRVRPSPRPEVACGRRRRRRNHNTIPASRLTIAPDLPPRVCRALPNDDLTLGVRG